jgi:protein-S-isoprenylcysteine O-methyltransferase Ste14
VSEGSRIYLGRRFGFLPANRGIVASGPFSIVRHPIYSGWFVLMLGLLMAYPTLHNALMLTVIVPDMVLRIDLEEQLLRTGSRVSRLLHNDPLSSDSVHLLDT